MTMPTEQALARYDPRQPGARNGTPVGGTTSSRTVRGHCYPATGEASLHGIGEAGSCDRNRFFEVEKGGAADAPVPGFFVHHHLTCDSTRHISARLGRRRSLFRSI